MDTIEQIKSEIRETEARIVALKSLKKAITQNNSHPFFKLENDEFEKLLEQSELRSITAVNRQYQQKIDREARECEKVTPLYSQQYIVTPLSKATSSFNSKFEAPRQSLLGPSNENTISISVPKEMQDFKVGDFLIILFHFDRNFFWKPKVFPPAATSKKGLFSTRTPHRPNPVGQSTGKVIAIEDETVFIAGTDLLNGTPILALRVYQKSDYHPDATGGWRDSSDNIPLFYEEGEKKFDVEFTKTAEEQLILVQKTFDKTDIRLLLVSELERSPLQHHNHRLGEKQRGSDGLYYKAVGSFKVHYDVEENHVTIKHFSSSLPSQILEQDNEEAEIHRSVLSFMP